MNDNFPDPTGTASIEYNPPFSELREYSRGMETTTEFGSPAYVSEYRSRSADRTKNAIDDELTDTDRDRIAAAHDRLESGEFVCVDRRLGRHPDLSFVCRLFVPKRYARIALSWATLLEPAAGDPDFVTLQCPDMEETAIRVLPEEGVTYVLGSDYTGEAKKSFLRLFMFEAKRRDGLGLHAGTKRLRLVESAAEERTVGQLFLGLSATGKTTLTCHGFGLESPERAELLQDDVCAMLPDGTVVGSEGGGLYIKTNGLSADHHAPLYEAATKPDAVLENVVVEGDGTVDFHDGSITTNGRASIRREDLQHAADDIDLDTVDHVFFITRNPLMPPIAKLSPTEGAAAFMLGESIQTSAGDPDKAGESIRVVGTNPFIIGSPGEEGNRFLELVRANDVECFLINTGHLGPGKKDIGVDESVTLITGVARGTIEWEADDRLGLTIPTQVPGMDISQFYPPDYVTGYDEELAALRRERRLYLSAFEELDPAVVESALSTPVERAQSE